MENTVITCLLIYALIFLNTRWCSCNGNLANNSIIRCKPYERAALLNFKHNMSYFDKGVSSSWEGEECCNWRRVVCDKTTGHILELDLYGDGNNLLKMEKLEYLVCLLDLKQLESLDLRYNNFSYSSIPRLMGSMKQLRYLYLSSASLSGLIPYELSNLTNLEFLDLSNNELSGKIPTSIGKLSKLINLDISHNPLEATVLSESHFVNLSSLKVLGLTETMLTLNLSSDWVPPFQLRIFYADNCKINGQFPPWLQTQKNLSELDLSNANISGIMPSWFRTMQLLHFVDLSNNKLCGSHIFPINFFTIDLSNNSLSGEFLSNDTKTQVYRYANTVSLTDNKLSGPLLQGLGHIMPNLESLSLSNNQISGQIPNSLCQLTLLTALDINNNSLWGEIPYCFANLTSLTLVRLSYNKLKGNIPCFNISDSYQNGFGLELYLHLNDNMLSGEIPSCWTSLTNLNILDIGGNQISGKMLKWFSAERFKELQILRLRGNKFSGSIPRQICSLPHLHIMDLGYNHFTGSIPRCLSNLTAMTSLANASWDGFYGGVSEVMQGIERAYTNTLPYLVDIDLSCNNLVGSIPHDMTKISGLLSLNLSGNQLSGKIPENIGSLKKLISLDLSKNKLRGSIPRSIGEIYTLSYLNLSYNNLSGQIPSGNQLQTLSDQASIYAGNRYLCGDFLPTKCKSDADELGKGKSEKDNGDKEKKLKKMGFELVVMSGFATGFWGVVGCLVVNRRWRHAFFRRLEDGYNWLYVIVVLKVRVLKAKIKRGE